MKLPYRGPPFELLLQLILRIRPKRLQIFVSVIISIVCRDWMSLPGYWGTEVYVPFAAQLQLNWFQTVPKF